MRVKVKREYKKMYTVNVTMVTLRHMEFGGLYVRELLYVVSFV